MKVWILLRAEMKHEWIVCANIVVVSGKRAMCSIRWWQTEKTKLLWDQTGSSMLLKNAIQFLTKNGEIGGKLSSFKYISRLLFNKWSQDQSDCVTLTLMLSISLRDNYQFLMLVIKCRQLWISVDLLSRIQHFNISFFHKRTQLGASHTVSFTSSSFVFFYQINEYSCECKQASKFGWEMKSFIRPTQSFSEPKKNWNKETHFDLSIN